MCGNHNYASREECNKCGIPKGANIARTGLRPGDWVCKACLNHNFASRTDCNKCGAPKDVPEGGDPASEELD